MISVLAQESAAGTAALAGVRTASFRLWNAVCRACSCAQVLLNGGSPSVFAGPQTLIAGFDVATGQVFGQIGDHRCETDFVAFLEEMLDRVATLRRGDGADRALAAALRRCRRDKRCGSPACPVCVRAWQRRVCTNMDRLFLEDDALHLVTLREDRWLYYSVVRQT